VVLFHRGCSCSVPSEALKHPPLATLDFARFLSDAFDERVRRVRNQDLREKLNSRAWGAAAKNDEYLEDRAHRIEFERVTREVERATTAFDAGLQDLRRHMSEPLLDPNLDADAKETAARDILEGLDRIDGSLAEVEETLDNGEDAAGREGAAGSESAISRDDEKGTGLR
jgi:hypothetical protein